MLIPNTDLLRTVSPYDSSGRLRPGHKCHYNSSMKKQPRRLATGVAKLTLLLRMLPRLGAARANFTEAE